jgi:26S proteasome regulatory subunit N3
MPAADEKKDVEMKDGEKKPDDGKEAEKKKEEEKKPKDPRTVLIETVGQCLKTIHAGTSAGDARVMGKVARALGDLRRTITPEVLRALIEEVVTSGNKEKILSFAPALDKDAPMTDEEKAKDKEKAEVKFPNFAKPYPPEFEAFAALIVLILLFDKKDKDRSFELVRLVVNWLQPFNRRTMDIFNAKAYFYLSLAYERSGQLSEVRPELMDAYRTACLRHEQMSQATLLNLLLRNYLEYNLYDQADKMVRNTQFPESRPNAQYARYLLYIGEIKAVQLAYSDSHSKLMQAVRKAPQTGGVAIGFKLKATKLAIIVELLMGGIPERNIFTAKELRDKLLPYFALTQAVRSGDLQDFNATLQRHEALFKKDKTLTLINRLRYNVIKTGLRSINTSYSRISLQDISKKLNLEHHEDAAGVVAKAVVDGVIDATIDYDQKFVKSQSNYNLYTSVEPQRALNKRIAFCLQMHNDAVKAMAYPDENDAKDAELEERRKREKEILGLIDDDDDDDMGLL